MRTELQEHLQQLVIRAGLDKLYGEIAEAKNELERVTIDLDLHVAMRTPKEKLEGHRRHIDALRKEIEEYQDAVKEGNEMLKRCVSSPVQPILPFSWERQSKGEFE